MCGIAERVVAGSGGGAGGGNPARGGGAGGMVIVARGATSGACSLPRGASTGSCSMRRKSSFSFWLDCSDVVTGRSSILFLAHELHEFPEQPFAVDRRSSARLGAGLFLDCFGE